MRILRSVFFIAIIYCLSGFEIIQAQVAAGFTVNYQTLNCNPATVTFNNTSTGVAPLSYEWNFGVNPGVNSILTDPSVTYLTCGTFSVVLKVTNGLLETDYDTIPVIVYCSPEANLAANPVSGCIPLNVQFSDMSSPGTGALNTFFWDFGDGNTGSGAATTNDYTISGCKNVTLLITDVNGCHDDTTFNNLVCVNVKPKAAFSSSTTVSCSAPFTINYTSASTGLGQLSYQWDFEGGNQATSISPNPSVTYSKAGSFDVRLIVTDSAGCTDTILQSNYASIASNAANFSMNANSGCVPFTLHVSGVSSSPPLSWNWTTNPSASPPIANVQDTSFLFSAIGTYQVCLSITYSGNCIANKCTTVTVGSLPIASFTVTGNIPTCKPPLTLNYSNTSAAGTGLNYKWFFPGGSPDSSSLQNPLPVVYANCGSHDASLIVSSGAACADTFSVTNVVNIDCPVALFNGTPIIGCSPLLTQFSSMSSTGQPTFWEWNFGDTADPDSVQSNVQNPSHLFTNTGCYTIRLITGNNQGCVDTLVDSNYVCVGIPPVANFTASPTVTCAFQDISFQNYATGLSGNTTFAWDFLDSPPFDVQSTAPNPFYHYPDTGWFNVTLIVCNDGCCDTMSIDSMIHILPPIAKVSLTRDCINPKSVVLHGETSEGVDTYQWSAPGGTLSSLSDSAVTVIYATDGNYHAELIVHNNQTGCDDTASVPVDIISVTADFYSDDTTVCSPHRVCFTNTSQNAVSYQWAIFNSIGNQTFSTTQTNPCRQITTADLYDVRLIATDANGCIDTTRKNKYITTYALNLALAGNVTTGCVPLSVTFSANGISSTSSLASYLWDFGDTLSGTLDTSSLSNPTHTYFMPGLYDVTLVSTDDHGCTDTLLIPQYIHSFKPVVDFVAADSAICLGQQACFTNNSSGTNLSYHWDFGDNSSSALSTPCHQYASAGDYTVTLTGTEPGGCADTLVKQLYIHVSQPIADFSPDSATSICPPLQVTFTNHSAGTDSLTDYEWLFGDGTNSNVINPFHIYNSAGYFDVTLIITNQYGCTDTIVYDSLIHVSGASATYTVTPASGCAPLNVCFIAHSGTAANYTWDFGNGTVMANTTDSVCYQYSSQGVFHPSVILDDGAGCVYSFPIDSVIVGGPLVTWHPSLVSLCDSGDVQFADSSISAVPIAGWKWNFGDSKSGALDSSNLQNPAHHYDTAGVYVVSLTVITSNGCNGSYSDTIYVMATPQVSINANDSVCLSTAHLFSASLVGGSSLISWNWDFGDAASGTANHSVLSSPQHLYQSAGNYIVTLISSSLGGCTDTASMSLTVLNDPVFSASGEGMVCKGLTTQLSATGASYYLWSPSTYLDNPTSANPVCTPFAPITYTVTGYSAFGCSANQTVIVDIHEPLNQSISPDAFICRGVTVHLQVTGGLSYSWMPSDGLDNSTIASPAATPTITTSYSVIIYDSICLSADTLSVLITVSPLPVADAGPDGTIFSGETYPIHAKTSGDILWSPVETLSCTDCADPVASPLQTTTYVLQTTNADGCRNSDEVVVYVLCSQDAIYIPDVFSPNSNGKNDVFRIRSEGGVKLTILRIYDRWGEEVFVTNDITQGWDGTYNGRLLPPAVYVFYLQAVCSNGDEIKKQGNITIVR